MDEDLKLKRRRLALEEQKQKQDAIQKERDNVPIRPLYDSAPLITVGPRAAQTIDELDVTLAEHESRLTKMNDSYQTLSDRTKELIEARHVLRETAVFFDSVRNRREAVRVKALTSRSGSRPRSRHPSVAG